MRSHIYVPLNKVIGYLSLSHFDSNVAATLKRLLVISLYVSLILGVETRPAPFSKQLFKSLHSNGLNWVGKKVRAVFVNVSRFVNIGYSMNCLDVYCNQLDRLYIDIEEKRVELMNS